MLTATGRTVDLLQLDPDDIELAHISHALARINRFGGLTTYSVAAHSIHVAAILEEQGHSPLAQLCGLMHDAHEAYLGDVIQPVKELLRATSCTTRSSGIDAADLRLQKATLRHFGIWTAFVGMGRAVHRADMIALATERRDLLPASDLPWPCLDGIEPHAWKLNDGRDRWEPRAWQTVFEDRHAELTMAIECAQISLKARGTPEAAL
jgi:hypothetical protein